MRTGRIDDGLSGIKNSALGMYIIRGLRNLPPRFRNAVVAIGNFDGVHRGHQTLFAHLRALTAMHGGAAIMAVTFEPHPLRLLNPERTPPRITGLRGKARWMEEAGVEALFVLHFNRALAAMPPETFVREILVHGVGAREVVVGENFRFGAKGVGTFEDLARMGEIHGFGVHAHPLVILDGQPVSSTWVRREVSAGSFAMAARLLDRPFEVEGRVVIGFQRGRKLGFPTANIALGGMLHPPIGVYVAKACVGGCWLPAVVNVGRNPTFGDADLRLEAHLLAPVPMDLYRKILRVQFLRHLRSEMRFPDVQALQAQIRRDVEQAQAHFASENSTLSPT
ncbi:MAG: riboflavin biosynthesis protein RibF [Magnetococcales bacterium]|nr:riboflavin biosynthesis protein RibF [Magnetococcales bacterium]